MVSYLIQNFYLLFITLLLNFKAFMKYYVCVCVCIRINNNIYVYIRNNIYIYTFYSNIQFDIKLLKKKFISFLFVTVYLHKRCEFSSINFCDAYKFVCLTISSNNSSITNNNPYICYPCL